MSSDQTNLVYDYMIQEGKKIGYKKQYKANNGENYVEIKEIKRSLLEMKEGAQINFINYLIEKRVFNSESTAKAFLSYPKYSQTRHEKRHEVSNYYREWVYHCGTKFKKISKNEKMEIYIAKLKIVWLNLKDKENNE